MILITESDLKRETSRQKKSVAVYSACAAVFLALSVTLLFLSKDSQYLWFMIADIALFTLFGWASVWFFTCVFADRRKLIGLYGKIFAAEAFVEAGAVKEVKPITKHGLPMCSVIVTKKEGERSLDVFERFGGLFEKGKIYSFTVRANVVTAWEAADEE